MKAIYPLVGQAGVSSSFEVNLKNPNTFRGSFSGSWIFSSTGATPDGSTGYMNTGLNLNTMNSINDISYGYYCRTNTLSNGSFGWGVPAALSPLNEFWIRYGNGNKYSYVNDNSTYSPAVSDCRGFNATSRIAPTVKYIQFNSTLDTDSTPSTGGLNSQNFTFSRGSQGYENRENAFGFIGDGLTATQMANFYTAVQRFQTTLGRQV